MWLCEQHYRENEWQFRKRIPLEEVPAHLPCENSTMSSPATPPDDLTRNTRLHYMALRDLGPEIARLVASAPSTPLSPGSTAKSNLSQTPLMWAASAGATSAIAALLATGASAAPTDSRGHSALHHAAIHGQLPALRLLHLAHPLAADAADVDGHTPLAWAARRGHTPAVVYLLAVARADARASGALWRAAAAGHELAVEALLDAGARPADADGHGGRRGGRAWAVVRAAARGRRMRAARRYALLAAVNVASASAAWHFAAFPVSGGTRALFWVTFSAAVGCCWRAATADPGVLPRGDGPALAARVDAALASKSPDALLSQAAFCYACLAPRLPRSKHSALSRGCVARFDHTCPFIANDVGRNNHRVLLGFASTAAVGAAMFVYVALHDVISALQAPAPALVIIRALAVRPWLLATILLASVGTVFSVGLVCAQLRQIGRGVTTYEELSRIRRGEEARNIGGLGGCWRNVETFWRETAGEGLYAALAKSDDGTGDLKV